MTSSTGASMTGWINMSRTIVTVFGLYNLIQLLVTCNLGEEHTYCTLIVLLRYNDEKETTYGKGQLVAYKNSARNHCFKILRTLEKKLCYEID